jgi:type I restriction enzyme S subunit
MKWETVRADVFCKSVRDGTHDTPKQAKSGYKLVTGKHIKNSQIDSSDAYYISEKDYIAINQRSKVEQWDVLMSMIGTVGEVAIVKNHPDYAIKNVALFKTDGSELKGKWLAYYLCTQEALGHMTGNMKGSSQQFLSLKQLRALPVPVAPEKYMQRVIDILSAYDDLIENNQKQIKLLEEAAQRLYKEWFVDLRFPGHENVKIVDGVPEGWMFRPFSEVFEYVRGKSYTSKELSDVDGVLMVNLKNIRAFGGYNRNAEKRFTGQFKDNQTLTAGEVVMGVTDMTQERRLVGHVALVPDMDEPMTFSMDLIKIVPKLTDNLFIYSAFYYGGLSKQISPLANGVNVLHLKPEAMMGIEMLIPNTTIASLYRQQISPIMAQIELLQKQCDFAAEARDRLLPKLMSGELEV